MVSSVEARRYGRIAGVGYLFIFVLAIHANFFVIEALPRDQGPLAAAAFIVENESLWRMAIAEFLVVMGLDILIAYALYRLLEGEAPGLNALSALFRLGYTVANIPVILMLFTALRWATTTDMPVDISSAMAAQSAFGYGPAFTLTLGFFGVHLLMLGIVIGRTRRLPRVLGALTSLAGLGYLLDALAMLLIPELRAAHMGIVSILVIAPALAGEGLLTLWLMLGPLRLRT